MHAFSNKAAQFHTANLFDIEMCTMEVSESVKGLAPYLALQVCQPGTATECQATERQGDRMPSGSNAKVTECQATEGQGKYRPRQI